MSNVTPLAGGREARPAQIDDVEWALRVKLAAAYRVFDHLGWTMVIFNHITMRVPGPEHHFLINPFGLRYDEVTASNLVKIDLDGNVVGGRKASDSAASSPGTPSGSEGCVTEDWVFNYAGFIIHGAIHANVPEAQCIMHTHTREGIAVSCKRQGLTNTNFYSAMIYDHVAYHDFEGTTVRRDEQDRLVASLGDKSLMIARNHGLLSHGRTVEEAFARLWTLQLACETQLAADSMPGETIQVSREATDNSTRDSRLFSTDDGRVGVETFAALERIIEARDPSYRT